MPRSKPYPLPPLRPFRMGETFRKATESLGLHPYPTPVAVNSVPYNGYPATTYCAWSGGFGPFNDERWHPGADLGARRRWRPATSTCAPTAASCAC